MTMKTRILLLLISFVGLVAMLLAPDARSDANSYLVPTTATTRIN
jgi:hypothetical protein